MRARWRSRGFQPQHLLVVVGAVVLLVVLLGEVAESISNLDWPLREAAWAALVWVAVLVLTVVGLVVVLRRRRNR